MAAVQVLQDKESHPEASQHVGEKEREKLMKSQELVCVVEDVSPISLPWDMTRKEYN